MAFKGAAALLPGHSSRSHSAPPIQELRQELVLAPAVRAQAELCAVCIVDIFFLWEWIVLLLPSGAISCSVGLCSPLVTVPVSPVPALVLLF